MLTSARSSGSKTQGFSLVELLVAMSIIGVLLVIVLGAFTTGLRTKQRQGLALELQQNLRTALQQIGQDLRASGHLHVWNETAACSDLEVSCSNTTEVSIVTLDGTRSLIPEPPGKSFNNSAETRVCNSSAFAKGDLILLYNGEQRELLEVTQDGQGNHAGPCASNDKVQHNKNKINGSYTSSAYLFRAVLVNYSLEADPVDASNTVLYRRTGLGTTGGGSGVVAFGVSGLRFAYGVPLDPSKANDQLTFHDSLEEAAEALRPLDPAYTADPKKVGGLYVGTAVRAVRVVITGTTPATPAGAGGPKSLTLTETVELRR